MQRGLNKIKFLFFKKKRKTLFFRILFLCGLSLLLVILLALLVYAYVAIFDKSSSCMISFNEGNKKSYYEDANLYKNNEYIETDLLSAGEKIILIENPVIISGKANVYEATVYIRIIDRAGKILLENFTSADGWMDQRYPFSFTATYNKPSVQGGYIEIFEKSPKDGSELNKVVVPVIFKD